MGLWRIDEGGWVGLLDNGGWWFSWTRGVERGGVCIGLMGWGWGVCSGLVRHGNGHLVCSDIQGVAVIWSKGWSHIYGGSEGVA